MSYNGKVENTTSAPVVEADCGAEPALRFPDFVGPWHLGTLGDFLTFKNGVNADKSKYGSGRKFINVLDMIAPGPITHERITGSVNVSDAEFMKNEVRYGDILFQRSSETREEVGQSNVYLDNENVATFGGFVIRGRPIRELNSRFFDAMLRTEMVRSDMTSRSGGSTRFNIGQESLALVPVYVPTLEEQNKIADFFSAIDAKLFILDKQKDALCRFKVGLTQKLLSQELRFKREDGSSYPDWKIKKLGDIFAERNERANPDAALLSVTLSGGVVRAEEVSRATIASADRSNYKIVQPGDIAYNSMRMWQGASGVSPHHGIVSPAYTVLRIKGDDLVEFWAHCFKWPQLISAFERYSQGLTSDTWNLRYPSFSIIPVLRPHRDEQRKIAHALSTLDTKIAAVVTQARGLQTFKIGLLQKMFI